MYQTDIFLLSADRKEITEKVGADIVVSFSLESWHYLMQPIFIYIYIYMMLL